MKTKTKKLTKEQKEHKEWIKLLKDCDKISNKITKELSKQKIENKSVALGIVIENLILNYSDNQIIRLGFLETVKDSVKELMRDYNENN
jgi:hypothetical protein